MPNLGSLFKSEISRIARREIRIEVQPLRKAGAAYRREIAALKRRIASLEAEAKRFSKRSAKAPREESPATETPTRFVAKGVRSLRQRLGLSAADFARLLNVSMQSVYNWERKKAVPRRGQIDAIVALRTIGRKEAQTRLEQARKPRKKSTRNR
ncbi:MAG: helix-turn-helix domain-containing protein [Rhodanobacteraceae bacterium]